MFQRLLVANRGEIACRILRTARRMGLDTVAVYSEADALARHVRLADQAVCIGPASAAESYLNIEAILAAARASGAEAVHPGYGFLSENARFAAACREAGLIFVGPTPEAIEAMGSKSLAKTRVRAAGIPVLPGYEGQRQDLEFLEARALEAGLPLIVKPAAGGGGKGMYVVRERAQLRAALEAARRLAESSFKDGTLLIERFVPEPRHIEVQVFADQHGGCIHLGDRDCSIQRRHQKLIEEAPAPNLPDALRARLRAAAVEVARGIDYRGAGTVEFIYDGENFYFLEMNTRLQVEHTVTEAVSGLDLVEWQLRVAAGEALPLTQAQVCLRGHAIEARICAEDPWRDFLPSAGRFALVEWPEGVRVDAGFESGDTVPSVYDSLVAKVIAHAPTRTEAASLLAGALERSRLAGVRTNERWLSRILRSAVFLEVRHSVALLGTQGGPFASPEPLTDTMWVFAALAALGSGAPSNPWSLRDGFCPNLPGDLEVRLRAEGVTQGVTVRFDRGGPSVAWIGSQPSGQAASDPPRSLALAEVRLSSDLIEARSGSLRHRARFLLEADRVHLWFAATHAVFEIDDPRAHSFSATHSAGGLTTPLPGVVVAVNVKVGQVVRRGETLMVIEAMKMEHGIHAPFDGQVTEIHYALGERVPEGSELIGLTASDEASSSRAT
ncbi:MAG: acetyl/propionyl/methylcrotonyl-CoA carboxylase subunit alpha [Steroidobacteraceae bacterium]